MRVAVGISTRNQVGYLQMTVPHNHKLAGLDADWYAWDDMSSDGTWEWLSGQSLFATCIRNKERLKFSAARNAMFKLAVDSYYDYLCVLDDDILLSFNWLARLVENSELMLENKNKEGMLAPFMYNDLTMQKKIIPYLGRKDDFFSNVVIVDGLGGACTLIPSKIFSTLRYNEKLALYVYEDADFHGLVERNGYYLGVDLSVSAVHLPWVVWLDPQREFDKLKMRHIGIKSTGSLKKGYERDYNKVLNRFILPMNPEDVYYEA